MSEDIRFDGRVAIVTGAGQGLGRSHALELARLGAKVVVNDPGGAVDGSTLQSGTGENETGAAASVVAEIRALGGDAIANTASVTDKAGVAAMVAETMETWGRIDILINNAGILRDKSFAKIDDDQFDAVLDVHLKGSWNCTKAVWEIMRAQTYGRVLFTSSSSGLYGNFGQANYAAAKMAVVGLMNTLHIEGQKNGIHVNCLAPAAATRMTEALLPESSAELLAPEHVTPAALFLVSEGAPSKVILGAGAGVFAHVRIEETDGIYVGPRANVDDLAVHWGDIQSQRDTQALEAAWAQTQKYVRMAQE